MQREKCPCCGYPTLEERGIFEICKLCNWEDDGQDDSYVDEVWGGPNYELSLTASRVKIGSELSKLAIELNGKVVTDPEIFFDILEHHSKRMHHITEKMTGDEDNKHPLWDEYRKTSVLIKRDLIQKK